MEAKDGSTKPRRCGFPLRILVITLGAIGTLVITPQTPASASGFHCARFGVVQIQGYMLPTGQYCFGVTGIGLYVNSTIGDYNTGWINNVVETVRFYDIHNRNYASFITYVSQGTTYGYHGWRTRFHASAIAGRVCGTLSTSGTIVVVVCNDIKR